MFQQNTGIRVPKSAETAGVQGDAPVVIDTGSSVRQKRAYLTDADKINLMKLCVEYQAEYKARKKTAFWSMISEMLLQLEGGGLRLRNLQGTVRGLVSARRATLKKQERETGIVQKETELTQAIDKWIEHEDNLERNLVVQKSPSTIEWEGCEAATQRMNLMVRRGRKKRMGDMEEEESEMEFEELDVAEGSESSMLGGRKHRKGKEPDIDESTKNTELLVGVVDIHGENMVTAATVSSESRNESQTSKWVDRLERRLDMQTEYNKET